jgi:hypothetical protein
VLGEAPLEPHFLCLGLDAEAVDEGGEGFGDDAFGAVRDSHAEVVDEARDEAVDQLRLLAVGVLLVHPPDELERLAYRI